MSITTFFLIISVHLMALVAPGPDFFLVLRYGSLHSRQAGLCAAFGLSIGVLFHVSYCLFGLKFVEQRLPLLLTIITICGAIYLSYIGVMAIKDALTTANKHRSNVQDATKLSVNRGRAFYQGVITNVVNPKAVAYFISFFAAAVANLDNFFHEIFAGFIVVILTFIWFSLVASLASMSIVQELLRRYEKIINFCLGIIFITFAVFIVWHRLKITL